MAALSIIFLPFEEKSAISRTLLLRGMLRYLNYASMCRSPMQWSTFAENFRNTVVENVQVLSTLNRSITVIWDVVLILVDGHLLYPDSRGSSFLRKCSTCVPA